MTVPNDADRGSEMVRVLWSLAGISGVILVISLYAKIFRLHRVRSWDYVMVIAFVCAIVQNALLTASCRWGLGRHLRYLEPTERVQTMKFVFLCQGWGVASPLFGRVSICLLLLNFAVSRTQRWFLWFLVVTQIIFNSVTIILIYVQCGSRVSALWDPGIDAQCWNPIVQRNVGFFQSSWNSFTDLALTVLPAIMLWHLKVELAKKVAVIILLSLSVIALVASIVKAYLIKELGARDDFTWNFVTFQLCASTEHYIVIICAATPALKILVRGEDTSYASQQTYELSERTRSSRGSTIGQNRLSASHTWRLQNDTGAKPAPPEASSRENILLPSEHWVVKHPDVTKSYRAV